MTYINSSPQIPDLYLTPHTSLHVKQDIAYMLDFKKSKFG